MVDMSERVKKVPIILQMEALECGAASLAMILAYYKKYVPLEKLRLQCSVSRDGCNAKNVLAAGRHNGMTAKGFSYNDIDALKEEIELPAIIHWNFNHFVVLCGFKKDKAVIADPAAGLTYVPMEEFEKSFTGIILTFEPNEEFVADGEKKSIFSFLIRRLKGAVVPLTFILLAGFVLSITGSLQSLYYQVFTDNILNGGDGELMGPLLMVMGATLVVTFLMEAFESIYLYKIEGKMSINSGVMFMWHVLRMPVEFFSQRFAGDISSRQDSNDTIASTICTQVAPIILDIIMIFVYFIILIYYNWYMTLIGLAAALINMATIRFISKKNEDYNKAMSRDAGKLQGATVAGVSMMETIKASGCEPGYFQKLIGYQTKYNNSLQKIRTTNAYISTIPTLVQGVANLAILLLGVYNILVGSFTIGMLMTFQGFMSQFLGPVNSLVGIGTSIQAVSGDMEKVEDVMNYEPDVEIDFSEVTEDGFDAKVYEKLHGDVDIDNLSFAYSPLAKPLIQDFNLHVKKGQMIALVGGSGSGKSTIAKIIAGLYEPREGKVLFDGKPRKDIDRKVFRGSLAMVDQDVTMFQDTIRNNITMWDTSIDDETLIQACKDAQIHDDILERQEGYDHVLVENGKDFSGGQRQRFEIARSFVMDPTIMILDEATSALDPTTEKKVMDAVRRRGITCFVVAHRLSTIRDADEIIMLENGLIVERGTHKELIDLDGKYAKLVKSE